MDPPQPLSSCPHSLAGFPRSPPASLHTPLPCLRCASPCPIPFGGTASERSSQTRGLPGDHAPPRLSFHGPSSLISSRGDQHAHLLSFRLRDSAVSALANGSSQRTTGLAGRHVHRQRAHCDPHQCNHPDVRKSDRRDSQMATEYLDLSWSVQRRVGLPRAASVVTCRSQNHESSLWQGLP
jgi:hypothetical protein